MTYKDALTEARRVGASKATGNAHLAQTVWVLSQVHAINAELTYNGALKLGITTRELYKLPPIELGRLQFED